ncbi:MAG TPA: hypothetical protein VMW15_07215 [Terracidiphilus sp.]|nr:hypothetical protein [Terracidiphilus sp.]
MIYLGIYLFGWAVVAVALEGDPVSCVFEALLWPILLPAMILRKLLK